MSEFNILHKKKIQRIKKKIFDEFYRLDLRQ